MMTESAGPSKRRSTLAQAVSLAFLTLALPVAAAADNIWPDKVTAKYKVTFNGFDIGDFRFASGIEPRKTYSLAGQAKLSLLMGTFKWSGKTQSNGKLVNGEPQPVEHTVEYKGGSERGSVLVSFNKGRVANTVLTPPRSPSRKTIPLTEKHLEGVLDPLTAVMVMTRSRADNPCNQTLPIFDGKQRFDLVLSFSRQQRIKEAQPSGEPELAYVCQVRYIPIAGHKNDSKMVASIAGNKGIELILRPIPSANILIPYRVTVPTLLGSVVLTSQRVEITTGMRQIALVH